MEEAETRGAGTDSRQATEPQSPLDSPVQIRRDGQR